jgi:hypothetical protein
VGDFGIAGPHTRLAAISCRSAYTYKLVVIYPDAVIIYFIAMRARGKLSTYTILHSYLSLSLVTERDRYAVPHFCCISRCCHLWAGLQDLLETRELSHVGPSRTIRQYVSSKQAPGPD